MKDILLGVNIDHIATLRQARFTTYPNLVAAAAMVEKIGADGITVHLREDRRHIQDRDIYCLKDKIATRLNLEMANTPEMLNIACEVKPASVCLVPEKREELTTEGGLAVAENYSVTAQAVNRLTSKNILCSLFIDAVPHQVHAASMSGAACIELHTGHYATAETELKRQEELKKIVHSVQLATSLGLKVNAGHGLNYDNVKPIAAILEIVELNIGHAIIAKAIFTGLQSAVNQMKQLMIQARTC